MRLDTAREETITNLSGSRKFQMAASAKAFQILSSGIYERKVEAIVRELSCNAYDSHVQAGKKDVPFRIQLPTPINDFIFAIEDFGVGLSEDEVYNVYTTYFESTKTDSNDVIGALGLGSKTPFSYTDSFTVKARKDGKECVFSAQISASGEPEVVKMYDRPWTGENGVEVSVEVAAKDVMEFRQCAEKVLSWFDVKPICNRELDLRVKEDAVANVRQYGYHLEAKDGYRHLNCKVVMGNVAYDLDLSDLKSGADENLVDFIDQLYNMKADVFFSVEIGDADVAASRETLSLDDRTKANLRERLAKIEENFVETTKAKVSSFSNVIEAYKALTSYERKIIADHKINGYSINDFENRSRLVSSTVPRKDSMQPTAEEKSYEDIAEKYDIALYGDFGYSWKVKARSKRATENAALRTIDLDSQKVQVIINDCERKMGLRDAIVANHSLSKVVMVVSDKNTTLNSELEKLIGHLTFNCYEVIYASTFWDGKLSTKKSSSGGLAKETVKGYVITRGGRYLLRKVVDFSEETKSRWAYSSGDGSSASLYFDNKIKRVVNYAVGGELQGVMEELDLDGIIIYNGNTEKKVKRILGDSQDLSTLIESKATKFDYSVANRIKVMENNHAETYMIFDDYAQMYNTITETKASAPMCSRLRYERDWSAKIDDGFEDAIRRRLETFNERLRILRKSSKVLDLVLNSVRFESSMVPEVKQFIAMKKKEA